MLLPIGDTPNPRGTPYVNYALIGLNVAVFLLVSLPLIYSRPDLNDPLLLEYLRVMGARGAVPVRDILQHVSAYDLFLFRFGFRPAAPSVLTMFTAMFLHGGWLHLAGNMLFLWIFGDNVELRLGRFGYLLTYLGTGVAATLFFALFVPRSQAPLIGASGAISGVLGCYFLWFPRNKVKTFIFLFPFIITTVLIPARFILGFFLLIDNLIPFLLTRGAGVGVAHGAHIGGFLAGLALAYALPRFWGGRGARAGDAEAVPAVMAAPQAIARSVAAGELPGAAAHYASFEAAAERRQVASDDLLAIGEHFLHTGEQDRALALFRRFIAERPSDPALDRAYLGAGKALLHAPRSSTGAYQYFLSALDLARSGELAEECRRHLRAIERLQSGAER